MPIQTLNLHIVQHVQQILSQDYTKNLWQTLALWKAEKINLFYSKKKANVKLSEVFLRIFT